MKATFVSREAWLMFANATNSSASFDGSLTVAARRAFRSRVCLTAQANGLKSPFDRSQITKGTRIRFVMRCM